MKRPSTSDNNINVSALVICATIEASLSLSPYFISEVAIVSFSLTIGMYSSLNKLRVEMDKANSLKSHQKQAEAYGKVVTPLIEELGDSCTALEGIVDNELWPIPKFTELLFTR